MVNIWVLYCNRKKKSLPKIKKRDIEVLNSHLGCGCMTTSLHVKDWQGHVDGGKSVRHWENCLSNQREEEPKHGISGGRSMVVPMISRSYGSVKELISGGGKVLFFWETLACGWRTNTYKLNKNKLIITFYCFFLPAVFFNSYTHDPSFISPCVLFGLFLVKLWVHLHHFNTSSFTYLPSCSFFFLVNTYLAVPCLATA